MTPNITARCHVYHCHRTSLTPYWCAQVARIQANISQANTKVARLMSSPCHSAAQGVMREARHSAEAARPVVPPAVMMVIALPRKGSLIGGKVSVVGDDVVDTL